MYQSGRAGDEAKKRKSPTKSGRVFTTALRGGECYLEKRGSRKNLGRISKYISKAFLISLEVSFLHVLRFLSLETFYQRVSRSD